ncbi:MAG: ArsB/NhaD family transporter [Anaerolineae bacterium]|nr:ArsB/NhaD family transporter [Anaerolineae bacterium]
MRPLTVRRIGLYLFALFVLACAGLLALADAPHVFGQEGGAFAGPELSGFLVDERQQPIPAAEVFVYIDGGEEAAAETESQVDGSWVVRLPTIPAQSVRVVVERHHYEPFAYELNPQEFLQLISDNIFSLQEITLTNHIGIGFWIAGITFVVVLALIALEKLQNTLAALFGVSVVFAVTFLGGALNGDFYIFNFERALTYINWEVIFLVMGMMIVVGIIEGTGIFQWLAFQAYRASRGRISLLIVVLVVITSIASALLDNVTTMLLMAPISIQIALALNISPLALLIPEILASNISGISTLIGTPTNILIGAYAGIGFNDFLINQTLGVLAASVVMVLYVLFHYRKELRKGGGGISPVLYAKLQENARIRDARALQRSLIVFGGMLVFFAVGESLHLVPAVTALVGATALLMWVEPDIEKMLRAVDWTTLVFFMALFMLVGAVQEVGILSLLAGAMGGIIGESLALGILVMAFGVGLLSFGIANVPLAAAMLPVVRFLSAGIPGAESHALYFALSMGAAMGGNGLLIGGETNLMTAGIAERAGTPITFMEFMKIGVPVTLLSLATGVAWLFVRFVVLGA